MRERPRPEEPRSLLASWRGKCVALGAAMLIAAVSVAGLWRFSAYRIRFDSGGVMKSSPTMTAFEETGEEQKGSGAGLAHCFSSPESGAGLPQCYSSPEANPSEGEWRGCPNGVEDSPATQHGWVLSSEHFSMLNTCEIIWNDQHQPGPKVPRPYWSWEPTKCSLDAVDGAKFCRAMEGRKGVLLVGDSLTRLSTTTLAAVLRAKPIALDMFKDVWEACGGRLRVSFMRNDFLDARAAPRFVSPLCEKFPGGPTVMNTRCRLFGTDETLRGFDTLVVNSGAHPRPAAQYGRQLNTAAEVLTSSMNRLHGKGKAILIVRNTVPGHWGCMKRMYAAPVNATVAAGLVAEAPLEYEWKSLHGRNAQLQKAFSPDKGWRLLDAYTPTVLRADSHIGKNDDCLHYCLPGPADHWITLLYNIILAGTNSTRQVMAEAPRLDINEQS